MEVKAETMQLFSGAFNLTNVLGTVYLTHTQTDDITLSAAGNKVINGWATIPIVANGDAISVPVGWINMGSEEISIVAGNTNHLVVTWSGEFYYYAVKVQTP